jgi:exodeoxyribonuclease V alpha subunit
MPQSLNADPRPRKSPASSSASLHNDENGFCVLRVKTKGHREETTVVGSLPSVTAGEWLVAESWWVRDKEHGLQFKATTMKTVPPRQIELANAFCRYLEMARPV